MLRENCPRDLPRTVLNNHMNVLILTHQQAQEVDGVIDSLRANGATVERINLCQYPEFESYAFDGVSISKNGRPISLDAGWFHNTGDFSVATSLESLSREISLTECTEFWNGLLYGAAINWVNQPLAIHAASRKLNQLSLAKQMSLPVPDFVVTNCAEKAMQFASNHPRVVIKSLGKGYIVTKTKNFKLYTRRLSALEPSALESLRLGPAIVQREIVRRHEVRVTVVGNQAFPVVIDCRDLPKGLVDIRQLDFTKNKNRFSDSAIDLSQIITSSVNFAQEIGLSYAGIDWVVSQEGAPYFLECNPLGAFKWYEMVGGHDITGAITKLIMSRT